MLRKSSQLFFSKYLIPSLLFVCMLLFRFADAATLAPVPGSNTYENGEAFSVVISVNSAGTSVNALSGTLLYPPDKLQVLSISKANSIVNFWVTEPSFSTASGKVHFEGIVLNPGYTGSNGKILTVTFKGKREGDAEVMFQGASVLANDGAGTNVLTTTSKGTYTIVKAEPKPDIPDVTPEPEPTTEEPVRPQDITLIPREELDVPVITEYPEYLRSGEFLVLRGVTYPNIRVIVSLTKRTDPKGKLGHYIYISDQNSSNIQKTIVKSDQNGEFTYASKLPLSSGEYDVWAEAFNDTGDRSKSTDKISFTVLSAVFLKFGTTAIEAMVVIIPLIALVIVLSWLLIFIYRRIHKIRMRIKEKNARSKDLVERSFNVLNEDVSIMEKEIESATSSKEKILLNQHKKDLETARLILENNIDSGDDKS